MKRRVISFITVLALCLSLCPAPALAAAQEPESGLCPHHEVHTEECGYVPAAAGRDCAHEHDENCVITDGICDHRHDESCGYAAEEAGAACTFVCRICPFEDLTGSASAGTDNGDQAPEDLTTVPGPYTEPAEGEQEPPDAANTPFTIADTAGGIPSGLPMYRLQSDKNVNDTYIISVPYLFDTNGRTYTVSGKTAMRITGEGSGYLTTGTLQSTNGAGIEIQSGGSLYVMEPEMKVIGTTYGLDIASGAKAHLSGGMYTGKKAAIHFSEEDGAGVDGRIAFSDLLVTGYAYFDENDNLIQPEDVGGLKTVVVHECTDHTYSTYSYTPKSGSPAHIRTCTACGTIDTEECQFDFADESGQAACAKCGQTITIAINEASLGNLVYDGTLKPADSITPKTTVKLGDGTTLTEDTDYTVDFTQRDDTGPITVTITGKTFDGTFTKTYNVAQAEPVITWDIAETANGHVNVNYGDEGPGVIIEIPNPKDLEELEKSLLFSYKNYVESAEDDDGNFTDGLPADAGTYKIRASLPETKNYTAAFSTIILTIKPIDPITVNPEAISGLTYNGTAQKLVTGGTVNPNAVGAEILFKLGESGTYSTAIPTGTNAGEYSVWYKVAGTNNYNSFQSDEIKVTIARKPLDPPDVELSYYTCVYDGGDKQPAVTVKDGETVLPAGEYDVAYSNNQAVGKATVTVTDKPGGNYAIQETAVTFEITPQDQTALTVTNRPDTVTYGDKFTLGTSGGSGNGVVTWEIIDGKDTVATINPESGQVTVKGVGKATVRATKSGIDANTATPEEGAEGADAGDSGDNNKGNHKDAIADWTFTAEKKPVAATVTADSKTYDGNSKTKVHIEVKQGVVSGDKITFPELEGTFNDANAAASKAVTVDITGVQILEDNLRGKYAVTYSSSTTPVTADIFKAEASIKTLPTGKTLEYDGTAQDLITAAVAEPTTTVDAYAEQPMVEYALSKDGSYSEAIPKDTSAGSYEVWYRVKATPNYVGTAAEKVGVTIKRKEVTDPFILLAPDESDTESSGKYKYTGSAIEPVVTVKETQSAGDTISSAEYTVVYKDNVNVGTATVSVTAKADGNYKFEKEVKFEIKKSSSAVLTSRPQALDPTYNRKPQNLVTAGSATNGHLVYAVQEGSAAPTEDDYKPEIPQRTTAGSYTVYYKVKGESNYDDTLPASISVTIHPKPVSDPVITLANTSVDYNGNPQVVNVTSVKDGDVEIETNEYTTSCSNNINAGTAVVHIIDNAGGNYIVNGTAYFTIKKIDIKAADVTKPGIKTGLMYNGTAQELITRGSVSEGGKMVYALDGKDYSEDIPTATAVGPYTVSYKVLGDNNHNDYAGGSDTVSIAKNTVTKPTITLSSDTFPYNGKQQKPTITVRDDKNLLIPENEYKVTYDYRGTDDSKPTNMLVDIGEYTVEVVESENSNYIIQSQNTRTYNIVPADQETISITGTRGQVYYGDKIQLGITGGTGDGTVEWSMKDSAGTSMDWINSSSGLLTVKGTGSSYKVTAVRTSSSNYKTASATWEFGVSEKPITAVVTVADKIYDGEDTATITYIGVNPGDLVNSDTVTFDKPYSTYLTATFTDTNAGTNKPVDLKAEAAGKTIGNYEIRYPTIVTANITPKPIDPTVTVDLPGGKLTYDGRSKEPAVTVMDGSVEISPGEYTKVYQNNTNAGEATVTVSNITGGNYVLNGSAHFTIEKATPTFDPEKLKVSCNLGETLKDIDLNVLLSDIPGTFSWVGSDDTEPTDQSEFAVIFTPNDTANYETVTIQVTVTVLPSGSGDTGASESSTTFPSSTPAPGEPSTASEPNAASAPVKASVQNGTASAALTAEASETLVNQAVAAQSTNIVIRPEIAGEVTKTEVSIPVSAVSRIVSETNAALTVSTPVADVSIPNAGLETLARAGGTVSVVTEQVDNTVVLTLTADGKDVGAISGGLTLTVPAADAGPGTVAVLVHADGTRETIRWSVAEEGSVRIPLSGSATVEIVDNSKEFTDVPAENWAADAVAFTSAHELFNGTGELTFSPEQAMSRAMLATVLYNLEGQPEQELTDGFSDVSGGAWYAASVSWASANGITGGYGDGQFGPDDSVTREQFAVMLWRYAGSPIAEVQALSFTDADQISGYAEEALTWAAAKGILNGYGDGRLDPGGLATRAQAAQILKNLIENA